MAKMIGKTKKFGRCAAHGGQRQKDWGQCVCSVTDEIQQAIPRSADRRNGKEEIKKDLDQSDRDGA